MTSLQPASDDCIGNFPLDEDVQGQGQRSGRQRQQIGLQHGLQIGAHRAEGGCMEVYGTGHGPRAEARTGVRYQSQSRDASYSL
jgi:hypothetical protein